MNKSHMCFMHRTASPSKSMYSTSKASQERIPVACKFQEGAAPSPRTTLNKLQSPYIIDTPPVENSVGVLMGTMPNQSDADVGSKPMELNLQSFQALRQQQAPGTISGSVTVKSDDFAPEFGLLDEKTTAHPSKNRKQWINHPSHLPPAQAAHDVWSVDQNTR